MSTLVEYKVLVDISNPETEINRLAEDGWEPISISVTRNVLTNLLVAPVFVVLLKRDKPK